MFYQKFVISFEQKSDVLLFQSLKDCQIQLMMFWISSVWRFSYLGAIGNKTLFHWR